MSIPERTDAAASSPWSRRGGLVIAVLGLLAVVALRRWDPTAPNSLWPGCVLHYLTGWWCPGCGSTRALGHAVRGEFAAALHSNGLVLIVMTLGASLWALLRWRGRWPLSRWITICGIAVLITATVAFTVIRNRDDGAWLRPPVPAIVRE